MRQVVAAGVLAVALACVAAALAGPVRTTTANFSLDPSKTEVKNPNAPELTIDAAGQTAHWDHCCDGGKWTVDFTWHVPTILTTGKSAQMTEGMSMSNVQPEQPILFQTTLLAPGFAQAFQLHYPNPSSGSKTWDVPIAADLNTSTELTVTVGVVSANIVYHFFRTTAPGGRVTVLLAAHQVTNEFGALTFAASGSFVSTTRCGTSCHLPLRPAGNFYGLQHDQEWHGLSNLRIKFRIVSARLDKGPGARLAVDIVAKVVSSLGTPGKARPGSPETCRVGQTVGVYAETGAKTFVHFGCGTVLHSYFHGVVVKIVGSALGG